jgi:L-glyceraldehyde 3-phosphate reductase
VEQNGLLDAAWKEKKGVIVYSPLAQGLLTDLYLYGIPEDSRARSGSIFLNEALITEETVAKIKALNEIAAARGESLAQMVLAWVLANKAVTSVLIGASKPAQIIENVKVLDSRPFSAQELAKIDEIALG